MFKYFNSWKYDRIILFDPLDGTLTDTTTLGQSGSGSNANKGVLHISQCSRTVASPFSAFSIAYTKSE